MKVREVQCETGTVNKTTEFQRTRTETMFQCEQLWQNTVGPQNHTCLWNTTNTCIFTTAIVLKLVSFTPLIILKAE